MPALRDPACRDKCERLEHSAHFPSPYTRLYPACLLSSLYAAAALSLRDRPEHVGALLFDAELRVHHVAILQCTRMLQHLSHSFCARHHGAELFSFLQVALEARSASATSLCCAQVRARLVCSPYGVEHILCSLVLRVELLVVLLRPPMELHPIGLHDFVAQKLLHRAVHPCSHTHVFCRFARSAVPANPCALVASQTAAVCLL